MDLSIIIVNYNTLNLTKACIDSVRSNTNGIDYEIIVVDNDSSDGSQDFFETCKEIIFIESGDNLGFGRANNLGFKQSKGRYILMLNSDTIVENDILTRMVNHFDSMPDDVACIGSLLVHGNRQPCFSHGFFTKWQWEFGFRAEEGDSTSIKGAQQDVEYVSGADMFVRRWVAEKYGLFDPDFFMYYEDMEICYRYKQHGLRSVLFSEHGIIHLDGASSKSSYRKVCMTSQSYIIYLRKTLPRFKFFFVKSLIVLRRLFTVWHYRWSLKNSFDYIRILAIS
ncbi:MAG: glycosyltransferase family 2 protein [Salinivirgaceae bacterium]|nr:glycosyltransferase family 2 protein [Salinivirgaceae bacterium]